MEFWNWLWARLRGEPQVKAMVSNLERQRQELAEGAAKLKAMVKAKEAAAAAALAKAKAHQEDADWAQRVADKFGDFLK